MPNPWDDLPIDTPTRIDETDGTDYEEWATRTEHGGTVETRLIPGGPTDLAQQAQDRRDAALAALPDLVDENAKLRAHVDALTAKLAEKAVLTQKEADDIGMVGVDAIDAKP